MASARSEPPLSATSVMLSVTCEKTTSAYDVNAITLPLFGTVAPTDGAPPTPRPSNGFFLAAAVVNAALAGGRTRAYVAGEGDVVARGTRVAATVVITSKRRDGARGGGGR